MDDWIVPPWYHPTTLLALDDEERLLEGLAMALGDGFRFQGCTTAREARDRLASSPTGDAQGGRAELEVFGDPLDETRFSRVSVMLVDYALSGLNGLDFIRGLEGPRPRSILYSGMSDIDSVEVALREGVVDCFIAKHDRQFFDRLEASVDVLARRFFMERGRAVVGGSVALLSHPGAAALLEGLRERHGCVEHYLYRDFSGFLLIDEDGRAYRLRIGGEETPADTTVVEEGVVEGEGWRWRLGVGGLRGC